MRLLCSRSLIINYQANIYLFFYTNPKFSESPDFFNISICKISVLVQNSLGMHILVKIFGFFLFLNGILGQIFDISNETPVETKNISRRVDADISKAIFHEFFVNSCPEGWSFDLHGKRCRRIHMRQ